MTHDRRFKKRVRARIAKTGESYTTAFRHLRTSEESRMTEINELKPLVEHDFGYSLLIPSSWRSYAADIYNSPLEVARYMRDGPDVAPGIVNVFWNTPGESPRAIAEKQKEYLENAEIEGQTFKEFAVDDMKIDGRAVTRLYSRSKLGTIENWVSRSHFMAVRGVHICLNMATPNDEADATLYERIAESFSVIERATAIVLEHDGETPVDFVSDLLVEHFSYRSDQATQRMVRINAQRESVVSLVDASQAETIVAEINGKIAEAGHSLRCRTSG
ncbi:MAG: ATP-dependent Clp protease adaptor ClpS [Pseudomonadota bacterium]